MNDLAAFGWNEFFARQFPPDEMLEPARVIAEHRSCYRVQTAGGECTARIAGRLRFQALSAAERPAVGDWVAVQLAPGSQEATIQQLLPRKSKFSRKVAGDRTEEQVVASNIDVVWIVSGLDGDLNLRRIERYLTLAADSGATPVVVLNKADLQPDADACACRVEMIAPEVAVHTTSCVTGLGLEALQRYLQHHATVALLGSSGVGKSTLINALAGADWQETGQVRDDGRGRHTTTHRQLLRLPSGGLIVDTPGMRELQLWDGQSGLADTFGEIEELASGCRFSDCRHSGEPGCAVEAAVSEGTLPADRLVSYHKLQRELDHLDRKQDILAQHQETRRFKVAMKSLRQHHPRYKRNRD